MAKQKTIDYINAKGWLTENERQLLYEIAKGVVPSVYRPHFVNIGVEYGASLACLRAGRPLATIDAIDIDTSKVVEDYGCHLHEMTSEQFLGQLGAYVNLVFVDGDHGYEGVKMDTGYSRYVSAGGYIIFHDCYDWPPAAPKTIHHICPGVNKAVEEWVSIEKSRYVPWMALWKELEPVDSMRIFKRME